ncbi:MAG: prolipoprotein diacylglyceryl transferase [Candidatus Melainabacteria bacterium]|nr:prolipoprotein diacylglyceryl transferase [Candidatus Melainabacteria bacterium]
MPSEFTLTLSSPGPIAISIGSVVIRWYGVFIGIGFLAAYFLAEKLAVKNKLSIEHFNNLIFLVLIFSIVCARLWFVFLNLDYFKEHLSEIPKIWYGGQSVHGGLVGGVFILWLYTTLKKISFYKYVDIAGIVVPLAQALGRWGNFFNNEAFGLPISSSLIRLYVPLQYRPVEYINYEYFHPTFLYESLLDFVIFIFLYKQYKEWKRNPGKTFWIYLLMYSTVRFCLEFLRVDSLYFLGFPAAQVISVIFALLSMVMLLR